MEFVSNNMGSSAYDSSGAGQGEEDMDIRKGPWTAEEDQLLYNYISMYGDGRWNSLARCAGLKRTGKSCRLRWFNYLRPDVKRGNITLQEQLLILQLHTRWGNRWSKIAQYLPGRTDNEIKNYWRTRVQKQAKQLKCDVNSQQFRDTMRCVWIPRLAEQIRAESESSESSSSAEHRQVDLLINGGGGAQMVPDDDPTRYYYKSHASVSGTSSDILTATTHVCADDMGLPDQSNIRACGPEMMGSSGGCGADQGMEQARSCWVGVGGGSGGGRDSIKNNHTWIDEDIYDELDVWLGIQ